MTHSFKMEDAGQTLSVYAVPLEKVVADLQMAFALDREGKIRQALIDMGWTPPPEDASARSAGEGVDTPSRQP